MTPSIGLSAKAEGDLSRARTRENGAEHPPFGAERSVGGRRYPEEPPDPPVLWKEPVDGRKAAQACRSRRTRLHPDRAPDRDGHPRDPDRGRRAHLPRPEEQGEGCSGES